jgi:hypothetical protein
MLAISQRRKKLHIPAILDSHGSRAANGAHERKAIFSSFIAS